MSKKPKKKRVQQYEFALGPFQTREGMHIYPLLVVPVKKPPKVRFKCVWTA